MGQSIGIRIDPKRKQPLHRQIFDEVVARIEAKAFPPGYRLPPSRVLARELGAHRNTVARAYSELESAGFVSSNVGRGTFVQQPTAAGPARLEPSPPPVARMPWSSLCSSAVRSEAIGRVERQRLQPAANDAINLARMQPAPDLVPEDLLRRCLTRATSEHAGRVYGYAPPEGTLRLRELIALDLEARGVPAKAADVLITSGSQQGLDLIARALINPGDTILVEPTTYSGAIDLFTLAGARLLPVPLDAYGPDLGALERISGPSVKALYLMPNAHNPSGRTLPAERRRALIAWSQASGIPIIEDDYAAGLNLEDEPSPPHLRALSGDVIHVSTYSKRLAPALRVGYVVAPAELRSSLISMKRVVDLSSSQLLQHALAEFMERGYLRAHGERMRHEYRARRDALDAALRKSLPADCTWHLPTHGIVMWLRLPAGMSVPEVYEEALRRGVLVSPGALWSVGANADPGLRLSFCAESSERLVEGARRLGKAIKQLAGRVRPQPRAASEDALEVV
ncbi:MAG TPA: PLP-dependent aminotransferase family protein [Polyangiales bacterium]|nr:PLP-dependent aminotransferase family protein [Polyangiales bacterium]